MKMFVWESNHYCSGYFPGHIVVIAKDVEAARRKAIRHVKKEYGNKGPLKDDRIEDLSNDLKEEPDQMQTLFVWGGD